ncbi:hypothetical protein AKJ47_01860 [candidate division MSBL1 archaeon SCGC-AAA261G05]|uniref:Pterin-binding domain-containing protein n=2 Tax=candidate division MSBL1 TaxID=215777 RepID=A0A133V189_9EURY|nr:hypothetical protein AKJ42_01490 [candidate division MSBL1 archaeon SCGC-AAA261C02]KXB03639.1 hypothetical protein AKJ47_01860 [candidate division MSBL1 archaeon SCGC-AAA261G05]
MNPDTKVLLLTGKRAEDLVKKYAHKAEVDTEVKVLSIPVASFVNMPLLQKSLKKMDLEKYSLILVPGYSKLDLERVEEEIKVPIRKGPKHCADIPYVLNRLDEIELSKVTPACELLDEKTKTQVKQEIERIEGERAKHFDERRDLKIGEGDRIVLAGVDFPPRIVAEVTDSPLRSNDEIVEIAERYIQEGAEILDIGMSVEEEMPQEIPRIISALRENFNIPLSINTTTKSEIEAALESGIDLVVSIDESTIEDFKGLEVPAVIIPRDSEQNYSRDPIERVEFLESLLEKANELNYERVIADPILSPVRQGFFNSSVAFHELRNRRPELPLFMGIGNVIELYDADSIGMTALLMGIANEINANFVLAVEASDKTRGSISEAVKARNMLILAEERGSVPKDLGLNLLKLKEKRRAHDPYDEELEDKAEVVKATPGDGLQRDQKGFFRIFVRKPEIIAVFHGTDDSDMIIKGKSAGAICHEIVKRNLISDLSHAAYLGRELQKAEIGLRTGRGYIQEEELF